ncbi:MAG: acetolactate synthase [Ruminococcaceae bacterium]|nr:acetolactate synthase [Oscillospiraceae bacterium]
MSIRQLTVFVENRQGAMAEVTRELAQHNVDLRALSMADTQEFGVLRLIVKDVDSALTVLRESGHIVNVTPVTAVKISDAPGRLSQALSVLNDAGINIEYLYAFLTRTEKHAYVVLRVEDNDGAKNALSEAGFKLVQESDIQKL